MDHLLAAVTEVVELAEHPFQPLPPHVPPAVGARDGTGTGQLPRLDSADVLEVSGAKGAQLEPPRTPAIGPAPGLGRRLRLGQQGGAELL